jgi:hypothetical protein
VINIAAEFLTTGVASEAAASLQVMHDPVQANLHEPTACQVTIARLGIIVGILATC